MNETWMTPGTSMESTSITPADIRLWFEPSHTLRSEIKGATAVEVALPHSVGSGKQAEERVRRDDLVLVQQGQLAVMFQHALDHEHHIGAAGVIFVETQGDRALDGPGQHALAEFGDLLAVLQDDGILTDQIDAADVAVEINPDQRPVQTGSDLLDMGRLARAVIALHHDAAIVLEAREDGERGLGIEPVGGVDLRHVFGARLEAVHDHSRVEAEQLLEVQLLGGFQAFERIGGRH